MSATAPRRPPLAFARPTPDQLQLGLRALKAVALAKARELTARERDMLARIQRFFGTNLDVDRLSEIQPDELAEHVPDRQIRHQLVGAMTALSLIDGGAHPAELALVSEFAAALAVDEKTVRDLEQLARHEVFGLRIDVLRRLWAVGQLRERVYERGLGEVLRFVKANVGRLEDPALAGRFRALRELTPGTLGREFVRFLDDRGWPLPGERGALSDIIVVHDMTHVLAGYGTDPAGEIETACFAAGYRTTEPVTFVLFVLLQLQAGVAMAPGAAPEFSHFDVERSLAALERGARIDIDLSSAWEYWQVVGVPVVELRERYGIGAVPGGSGAPTADTGSGVLDPAPPSSLR